MATEEGLHGFQQWMGFVPVFFASCPPSLSLSLLRKTLGVRGLLSAPAVDSSRDISLWPGWLLRPVCCFCQSCAHAVITPLPDWASGHLCAESFIPSRSIALQQDKWPFHRFFTEGTPFFLLPGSHPLSPWHPQALGTPLAQAEPAGCPEHSATATTTWPTRLSWAKPSPWWPPQKLIPC